VGKRANTCPEEIADWQNLVGAAFRASRGKTAHPDVAEFLSSLDAHLAVLRAEILGGTVSVGTSTAFRIRDPKPRLIHAPCFRERVLHHAVMARVGPVLDRALIDDTFACRIGKGTLAAVRRSQQHAQRFPWYAKADIRGYFASIDHAVLKAQLARRFKSQRLLHLLDRIIDAHHDTPGKGLPIGALTSQYFANSYLDPCDRFLLESRGVSGVVRYMDDFLFWDRSRERVNQVVQDVRAFTADVLRLTVKDGVQVNRSSRGVTVCGYRVYPGTIRLAPSRRRRYRVVKRRWETLFHRGDIDARELQRGIDAAVGITAHADAAAWRRRELDRNRSEWDETV
jgi:RNA-directed DNA polymerase